MENINFVSDINDEPVTYEQMKAGAKQLLEKAYAMKAQEQAQARALEREAV